jgi:ABC-2 type transport system ATP-binding protein
VTPSKKGSVIVIEGLTKVYPGRTTPAIEGVNLELRDGEVLGLVGLNGAGKTTTIRAAAGVSFPTGGRILVDGHDIVQDKVRASQGIGWVPELFPFGPEDRARRLLVYFAGFHDLRGDLANHRARDVLERVGLAGSTENRIGTFSQGMRRRFGLAAAMLADPQNLLLDEILNGLDPEGMAFVRGWVVGLRKENKSVLLSSHLLSEVQALADRIAFIHHGHLIRVVDRGELARAGKPVLHVTLHDPDSNAAAYLSTVGTLQTVDGSFLVTEPKLDSATICAELVKLGYHLAEIWLEDASLEGYFLELIHSTQATEGVAR